jgi:signal transduction histidine kinase
MDPKECILVVDDEESQRKTLSLILKKKGYEVESAGTGKEALEKAQGRTINVSLLDIKLPDTDGIDLVAPLKQINPYMVIIMVTGFASVENTVRSLNAGASGYLVKPINNDELLAKVQDLLERQALIREKRQAEEALRHANKQLNLLSSITRHDILNQLMVLKGYLDLSRDYLGDNKTLSDFLAKEENAANTIEHQIRFTKDYQELGAAAPEWQNVNASIQKAVERLPMRDVRIEPDPADPEVEVDPLFDKVFYNLIDNALRYGGEGMKMIRFFSLESDTSLTIICEDDGVGITAEDKKRLFTRGFGKNTGLGLFLSREILSITGITITENGVPGKGARFEITVPKGAYRMNLVTEGGHGSGS